LTHSTLLFVFGPAFKISSQRDYSEYTVESEIVPIRILCAPLFLLFAACLKAAPADPEVLAEEIIETIEAALASFREVASELNGDSNSRAS
jgi:hypothetical protein